MDCSLNALILCEMCSILGDASIIAVSLRFYCFVILVKRFLFLVNDVKEKHHVIVNGVMDECKNENVVSGTSEM